MTLIRLHVPVYKISRSSSMEWTVACSCLSKHILSDYTDSLLTNIAWPFMYYVVCTVQGERESHEFHTGMQFRSDSLVQVVHDDPFKCYSFQF